MHFYRPATLMQPTRTLLRRMLPACCALCGDTGGKDVLCDACIAQFIGQQTARCPVCAAAMASSASLQNCDQNCGHNCDQICGACLSAPPAFDATIVACDYEAPVDHLVQDLKFHARLAFAPLFARLLARAAQQLSVEDALLTIVPLSASRLAQRGFNQANEIAKPLARELKIPLAPQLCVRVRDTAAQAGLPLRQRQLNMRDAFALTLQGRSAVLRKHIFVVDDVMTTGHTLHELAACLKRHGAARVTNLVFARTPGR